MKIVMLEPLAVSESLMLQIAKPLIDAGHDFHYTDRALSDEEKKSLAADADALIIGNAPLSREIIESARRAKLLSVGFTGVDHVDLEACKEAGITVCNAQGYATEATAELALALMLICLRSLGAMREAAIKGGVKSGRMFTLKGKTVGIIGTGAIGKRTAELCLAFGAKVLGYNRRIHPEAEAIGIQSTKLETLLHESDIVSLHLPLTKESKGLIDAAAIASMKDGAILINCARGAIVDSEALAEALERGKLSAAGIDVLEMEPPFPQDHPLLRAPHVFVTPHIGFFTEEAMKERAELVIENITAWLSGHPIRVKNA